MKVYEALARAFSAEGTTAVFGMMGNGNLSWIGALDHLGIPVYEVRHEGTGVSMAEGWGRVTGIPGVCTTTSAASTSQIATAMLVASRSRMPLVAFCGDRAWGSDDDQSFDQRRFADALECGFVQLTSAESAYEAVRSAFYLARLESRPILFSVPSNLQQMEFDELEEYVSSNELFPDDPVAPNPELLARAADLLASSSHPVVLVGRGAQLSEADDAVCSLADRSGALVVTSLLAMNWLKGREPFHAGVSGLYTSREAMELFQEADCVVAVGAAMNHYTVAHGYLYPNARIIQIDSRPHVVMGDGRAADCYVHSDARLGVEALDRELADRHHRQTGYRTPEVAERLAAALEDPATFPIPEGQVDPREVCRLLDESMPPEVGLSFDSGHQSHFPAMLFSRPRELSLVNKGFGGCVGQGLVTAIGAVLGNGRKPMVVIQGDTGFMMHFGEFETVVRYDLPILDVVMNNEALGTEVYALESKGFDPDLARIPSADLGAAARALGARGQLVRSIDELRTAVEDFLGSPGPMLLDVRIAESVLSIQRRRLAGQDDI